MTPMEKTGSPVISPKSALLARSHWMETTATSNDNGARSAAAIIGRKRVVTARQAA
jgi:hypothetical protein